MQAGAPAAESSGSNMETKDDNVKRLQQRIKSGDYVVDARAVASAIVDQLALTDPTAR